MFYYTQLIFIREGKEKQFLQFEELVLPLLKKYNGKLVCRVRPSEESIIETKVGNPYEIHLISFAAKEDFNAYVQDEERQKHLPLKNESIESALLIEGAQI